MLLLHLQLCYLWGPKKMNKFATRICTRERGWGWHRRGPSTFSAISGGIFFQRICVGSRCISIVTQHIGSDWWAAYGKVMAVNAHGGLLWRLNIIKVSSPSSGAQCEKRLPHTIYTRHMASGHRSLKWVSSFLSFIESDTFKPLCSNVFDPVLWLHNRAICSVHGVLICQIVTNIC